MTIIVFKYADLPPTSTFVQHHVEGVGGGFENFMYLENWSLPKLGNQPLWGLGFMAMARRRILLGLGHSRQDLHRRAFASALKRRMPQAVLAEFGYSGALIWRACCELKIPLVVHFHGTDLNRRDIVDKHIVDYREMFEYATGLIAVSDHDRQRLLELGASSAKIHVVPCGAKLPLNLNEDERVTTEFRITSVGRFVAVKAPQLTILAFHKYLLLGGTGRLHMVGDGELLPFCETLVRGLDITDQVIFHGRLPNEQVLQLLRTSHLYVMHSVVAPDGDCEGMPVSIMEAAAHRIPIVSSKIHGVIDHFKHEENACLVEQYDTDAMAQCMYDLWQNRDKAKQVAQTAYELARKEFDVERQTQKVKEIILNA